MSRRIEGFHLKKVVSEISANTRKKEEKNKKKRAIRAEEKKAFSLEHPVCGQTKPKVLNSSDVMDWFRQGITDAYGDNVSLPNRNRMWSYAQRSMAKELLEMYEPEDLKRAILYMCENWKEIVASSEGRLHGLPTIQLFRVSHMMYVEDAKSGKKYVSRQKVARDRRDADEYRDGEHIGLGWG